MLVGYVLLTGGAVIFLMPIFWMVSTSFKQAADIFAIPIQWWPAAPHWRNYVDAWSQGPFPQYFYNSLFVALAATGLSVIVSGFAGYALAKLDFIGKRIVFLAILATLMLPGEVLMIPTYLVIKNLGWINTYQALIVPTVGGALGVFLMRQTFLHLPDSLLDAARIDGASELRIYFQIVMPLFVPGLLTLALIEFRESWDQFLWPMLVTSKESMRTVPVGLNVFRGEDVTVYNQLMAMATLDMLPLFLLFLFFQRAFIQGIASTGIKE
jgi:multiple sugar transport system permease protein